MKPANNILNLLLGIRGVPAKGQQSGPVAEADPGSGLFGDILGLFAAGKVRKSGPAFPETGLAGELPGTLRVVKPEDKSAGALPVRKAVVTNPSLAEFMICGSARAATTNPNLAESLICRPVLQMEPGVYKILNARVTGGRLELEVQAAENGSHPVKLSLPVAMLKWPTTRPVTTGPARLNLNRLPVGRVGLQQTDPGMPKIDELVSRLNLKMIEISPEISESAQTSTKDSVRVKIIAVDAGNEIVLKGKLAKQEIKARIGEKRSGDSEVRVVLGKEGRPRGTRAEADKSDAHLPQNFRQNAQPRVLSNVFASEMKALRWGKQFELADRLGRAEAAEMSQDSRATTSFDLEKLGAPVRVSHSKLSQPIVRFRLPDNIGQVLRPNGESILLRIEPDHLGPARLHLNMRGDLLSARVVVESVQACATIEGSLDKLTEQLSRAGIEVDHIEVAVEGGDARSQFFDRHRLWNRSGRFSSRLKSEDLNLEPELPSPVIPARPVEYVSRHGVNLFA